MLWPRLRPHWVFPAEGEYEKAVRHLLGSDSDAIRFVREMFGDLLERMTQG